MTRFLVITSKPQLFMQIGQYIASNGGVVTAEELAPYLDLETSDKMVSWNLTHYNN